MPTLTGLGAADLRQAVLRYRDALRAHQEELNRLNVYPVPDGDTGTNMALTLESVCAELGTAESMAEVCHAISRGSLMGARGNSGVITSQILRGFADVFRELDRASAPTTSPARCARRPTPRTRRCCARSRARSSPSCARRPRPSSSRPSGAHARRGARTGRGRGRAPRSLKTPDLLPGAARGRRGRRGRPRVHAAARRAARGHRRPADPGARRRRRRRRRSRRTCAATTSRGCATR